MAAATCSSIAGSGCHHSTTLSGDSFLDDLPVRLLCGHMDCSVCSITRADVRPGPAPMFDRVATRQKAAGLSRAVGVRFLTIPEIDRAAIKADAVWLSVAWPRSASSRGYACGAERRLIRGPSPDRRQTVPRSCERLWLVPPCPAPL
jgi:hypothetical protein